MCCIHPLLCLGISQQSGDSSTRAVAWGQPQAPSLCWQIQCGAAFFVIHFISPTFIISLFRFLKANAKEPIKKISSWEKGEKKSQNHTSFPTSILLGAKIQNMTRKTDFRGLCLCLSPLPQVLPEFRCWERARHISVWLQQFCNRYKIIPRAAKPSPLRHDKVFF